MRTIRLITVAARRAPAIRSGAWFWPFVALTVMAGLTAVTLVNRQPASPTALRLHEQVPVR